MYKSLIIAHPWLSDQAVITATSEQGSMPASNLLRSIYPTDPWRSQGAPGTVKITMHLPEIDGLAWNLVAPLYTNAGPDATWQVIAAATSGGLLSPSFEDIVRPMWPAPNMDAPGEPDWRHAFRWLGDAGARSEPWVQLILDDPAPLVDPDVVSPFMQWGRLYVALGWQPGFHHDKGAELTPANERGRRVTTQGGGTRVGASARPRAFRFNVPFLSRDEVLTKGWELDRIVGTTRDLLVIDAPDDPVHPHKGMIYGTLPQAGAQRHDGPDDYSRAYAIEEML